MLPARVQQSGCGQENAPQQVSIKFNPPHHTNTTTAAAAATPRHPKTNKHTEQRGIHHRCFWFDKSLCFSITIISPELDKGSGRGWKMETQWIWPATKRKLPPPPFFFSPCAPVGNDSTAQKLQRSRRLYSNPPTHTFRGSVRMEPTGIVKKALLWKWFNKGGGEEKRYSKLLLDFFFSSRVAGKDHKTMKNNGLTASKKVSDWAPNTAHHVMCVSELSPGFGLKLHQISRWLTGNHQHKAARISPHYVAANCAASHDFTQTMFLFPGIIKKGR